jgi:hypothetical protein
VTYFADLAPCDYFGLADGEKVRAVAWLDNIHPFPTGTVATAVVDRLIELSQDPFEPVSCLGFHKCEICPRPTSREKHRGARYDWIPFAWFKRRREGARSFGARNIFVPGRAVIYAAPTLITHYILVHHYVPPAEFIAAVRSCPDMMSPQYEFAMKANGPDILSTCFDEWHALESEMSSDEEL